MPNLLIVVFEEGDFYLFFLFCVHAFVQKSMDVPTLTLKARLADLTKGKVGGGDQSSPDTLPPPPPPFGSIWKAHSDPVSACTALLGNGLQQPHKGEHPQRSAASSSPEGYVCSSSSPPAEKVARLSEKTGSGWKFAELRVVFSHC